MEHDLKCWPEYFQAVKAGKKTLELRYNDRKYLVGDILNLQEYEPEYNNYSGDSTKRKVTHCIYGPAFGIMDGYVAMSIKPI